MKRRQRQILAALAGLFAGGFMLMVGDDATAVPDGFLGWRDPSAPDKIAEHVRRIENVTGPWPGLAAYLTAVALWESRGVTTAEHGGTYGLFQIHPATADATPAELQDPARSVAYAVDLIFRLRRYADRPLTWMAVRRGWKYPALVDDWAENDRISRGIRRRFVRALRWLKISASFARRRAIPQDIRRPTLDELIAASKGMGGQA